MRKRKYTALSLRAGVGLDEHAPAAVIHNIVATTQISSNVLPLDLQHIADVLPNSHYDRQRFAAITIRMHAPTCTALLFTSGKLVLTGCRGWNECVLASMHIVRMLRRYMPFIEFYVVNNTIQNIVAHVALRLPPGARLNIEQMYDAHSVLCTYQPQLFPGLIYRPDNSPIVLICFHSGNIVVTGGRCLEDIDLGWRRLWPVVNRFVSLPPAETEPLEAGPPLEAVPVSSCE
jgi:transcription initiation factor TFIID TATA-box-binding protein